MENQSTIYKIKSKFRNMKKRTKRLLTLVTVASVIAAGSGLATIYSVFFKPTTPIANPAVSTTESQKWAEPPTTLAAGQSISSAVEKNTQSKEEQPVSKVDIREVNLKYISSHDEYPQKFYELFDSFEYLSENHDVYHVLDNCAYFLSLQNTSDKEVEITKFFFQATDIKVLKMPYLLTGSFSLRLDEDGEFQELHVLNIGNASAENIKIWIDDKQNVINTYFDKQDTESFTDCLKAGNEINLEFLRTSRMKNIGKLPSEPIIFTPIIHISYDRCTQREEFPADWKMRLSREGIENLGGGGFGDVFYGIRIDTALDSMEKEENISEFIQSGETLTIPIGFFPDQSCEMAFKIGLEINGEYVVETDEKKVQFTLRENNQWQKSVDTLNKELHDYGFVTFPYSQEVE